MTRGGLAVALALLGGGCASDAILELEVFLPAMDTTARVMTITRGARSADPEDETGQLDLDLQEFARPEAVSVVDDAGGVDRALFLTFTACLARPCARSDDTRVVEIERPFYAGRRTHLTLCVTRAGSCGEECVDSECAAALREDRGAIAVFGEHRVDRCQVRGCVDGESRVPDAYCRADGDHFCQ